MKGDTDHFPSPDIAAPLSIIVARVFYAVNWFNVAAIYPLIAIDLGQDIALLGSISAAFFLGVGMLQVPAGILATRYSPQNVAIFGIVLSSTAALLSGFATEASQLVWLRFIVGAGMAFFFSSAIVLIARYAGTKSSGLSIGVLNSAHSVGGVVGIFAWIIIAQLVGWRPSLILSGAVGIATAILMFATMRHMTRPPKEPGAVNLVAESKDTPRPQKGRWLSISELWKILSNPSLVALGLVLTGVQASWALMLTFIVVYLQSLNIPLQNTGMIASMALISAIVSAPLIGRFYDKTVRDARKILFVCGVGISAALAALSISALPVIIAAVIAIGFFSSGAFTVAYAKARITRTVGKDVPRPIRGFQPGREYGVQDDEVSRSAALNVALINGLSLVGILWMPLVFSFAVKSGGGYPNAWLLSAVLTALFMFMPLQKVGK